MILNVKMKLNDIKKYWYMQITATLSLSIGNTLILSSQNMFFFPKNLYWSIIALQWCVSFCCITKWISHTYTHIPISPPSCVSLHPPYPTPLGGHKAQSWSPCAMQLLPTSYPFYIWYCIYVHATLSPRPSPPLLLPMSSSSLYMSVSLFLSCP